MVSTNVDEVSTNDLEVSTNVDRGINNGLQGYQQKFKENNINNNNTIKINNEVKVAGNSILAPQDAEIYNINGLRVNGENLTPGIYVVRLQDSIKKVIVK